MLKEFAAVVDEQSFRQYIAGAAWPEAFDLLTQSLHERLYDAQTFDLLDDISVIEKLILAFDYVQMQVGQGGFIQLIQNGYVSLMATVIESLQQLGLGRQMSDVLDDALKIFVLNNEALSRDTSVEDFGKLYAEYREFEPLEFSFERLLPETLKLVVLYVAER